MSTLRGYETFDDNDNAKNKRRKVIRVVVIIVVILILLIGSAALLKSFVIDKNSNDSTHPPFKPNDTIAIGQLKYNLKSTYFNFIQLCTIFNIVIRVVKFQLRVQN